MKKSRVCADSIYVDQIKEGDRIFWREETSSPESGPSAELDICSGVVTGFTLNRSQFRVVRDDTEGICWVGTNELIAQAEYELATGV